MSELNFNSNEVNFNAEFGVLTNEGCEVVSNKVSEITSDNKNSTDKYTSVKAVSKYVDDNTTTKTYVDNAILTEKNQRIASDEALTTSISAKANTSYVNSEITDERTRRIEGEATLLSKINEKQNTLVSGTNIKTINGNSILGSGNIEIAGGSGDVADVTVNGTSVLGEDKIARVSIPTNVSSFTNDAGYITSAPSKTSELTNDSGFITEDDIPTIPTKTSELTNDSNFTSKSYVDGEIAKIPDYSDKLTMVTTDSVEEYTLVEQSDLVAYATKTYVDTKIGELDTLIGSGVIE